MLDVVMEFLTVALVAATIIAAFVLGVYACAWCMAKDAPHAFNAWQNVRKARRKKHG